MGRRTKGEGGLFRRPGSPFWYAQYYRDGKPVRVSTETDNKQEALGVLRRLMGDHERGLAPLPAARKLRYGDLRRALIDDYIARGNRSLEQRADGSETIVGLKQLDDFFGFKPAKPAVDGQPADPGNPGVPVINMSTDAAREFARKRQKEGAGPAMINRSLACMRRMLHLAYEDAKIQHVPKIRMLKEPGPRKGFLEQPKFEDLLKALPSHLRPLVGFLYWTGVRFGEALAIEWDQVDLANRLVRLDGDQTKNSEPRIIPLAAPVIALLQEIEPKTGPVFSDVNLRTEWAQACEAVGLGTRQEMKSEAGYTWHKYCGLIIHDLRRSAVRNLIRAGVNEHVAMKISGHKTAAVFRRYNIVSVEDVQGAMRAVEVAALNGEAVSAKLVQKSPRKHPRNTRKLLHGKKMGA